MKVSHSTLWRNLSALMLPGLFIFGCGVPALAQTNSWIATPSAKWENNVGWSLGILPDTNQDIFITNAGWKAIAIDPITAQNFSQSLTVKSLTISSPTNSANEVLMNYAGLDPLVISGNLTISDANSSFVMFASALDVNGVLTVNGTFDASGGSVINLQGYYPPPVQVNGDFNLTNSLLNVSHVEMVNGTMNQRGGTNLAGAMALGGTYNLFDGTLITQTGTVEMGVEPGIWTVWGSFNQWGGTVIGHLSISQGTYNLAGGILNCGGLTMPAVPSSLFFAVAGVSQSGGTNYASGIQLGTGYGQGYYTLSGGTLSSGSVSVNYSTSDLAEPWGCTFTQSGGYHTNGSISIVGLQFELRKSTEVVLSGSYYNLSGGTLESGEIRTDLGAFNQSGGTAIAGTISGTYNLSGGFVSTQNIGGTVQQTGGTNRLVNLFPGINYTLSGGLLISSNLVLTGGGIFQHGNGTCSLTSLTLDNGTWQEQTNGQIFGQLQLGSGTNSIIQFPTNSCVLKFANSSSLAWSNTGVLTILGWNGSPVGGGLTQIIFGTNASSLTAQQLAHIQFANPAGQPPGNYLAKMLSTGELVPGSPSYLNTVPAPFFAGQASLGNEWYYLSSSNQIFGYYNLQNFPYIHHLDLGWEYFTDSGNAAHGGYFYDFSDSVWFYTQPDMFPYLYDFKANAWLYYNLQAGMTGRYTSNPRWFYNFSTQTWTNHL